jgi:hypothetical protein
MDEVKFHGGFSAYERSHFVSDLLNKQVEIRNMLDLRTNIMIGFDSALIVFFATNFNAAWAHSIFFVAALIAVIISMFFSLMALKPSHFVTKKHQHESLFYHQEISQKTEDEYKAQIFATLADENKVYESYILEVYNLTKFSNMPRKYYLNWSIRVLLYGVFISLALFLISLLPNFVAHLMNLPMMY